MSVDIDYYIVGIQELKKKLELMEMELYKIKASQLEEEELDENEIKELVEESVKLCKSGKGLTTEEFKKVLGV